MHKREEGQFFDGLLLGALLSGLVIVLLIVFFLLHNVKQVGEDHMQYSTHEITIAPINEVVLNNTEIGQIVAIEDQVYSIDQSFTNTESDLTYRTLKLGTNLSYASIWTKNGEQLLYKANNALLTVSGNQSIAIIAIKDDHTLLLQLSGDQEVVYNLQNGMISANEYED